MVLFIIGNNQRENYCMSFWSLISRHYMMLGFSFCQTGLIRKVLEDTGMEHCNGFTTPPKVDAPLETDENGSESKRDGPTCMFLL